MVAPMANTMKSVMEVTVMATPALRIVSATLDGMSGEDFSSGERLS